jgi:F-type H+-transporting ATPase subunit b
MIATSADAVASASDAASDTGFSASATAPTVVASTVPLTNAAQLAQASSASGATATTEKPAEEGGMPQLNTAYWPGQIAWLLIIFAVFFVIVAKVFAPRLRKVIDQRGETIAEDLANARANRDEAEAQAKQAAAETAAAHVAAKKLAAEAVARSNAEIAAVQAEEDKKLNARLSEADARIRTARDEAMSHVRDIATDTAQALVEKLTGKSATATAMKSALGKVS